MRNRFAHTVIAAAAGALIFSLVAGMSGFLTWRPGNSAVQAEAGALRRTADGKPDLNGIWQAFTTAAWDLEDHNARKGEPAGQTVVQGGPIPYQPAALAKRAENREPTRCGEEHAVDGSHRWTIGSPPQDAELVAEHHDLQLLEVARPTAKHDDLEDAAQHDVSQRNEHEASGA